MTNHIHLALQVSNIPLSSGLHNLSFRYTRWINWRENRTGRILGDDSFMDKCLSNSRSIPPRLTVKDIADEVCLRYDIDVALLKTQTQQRIISEARAVVGWLARELDCATLTDVGKHANRDGGSISSPVRRLSERLKNVLELAEREQSLKATLEKIT